jgi:hypothetical protein
MTTLTRRSEVAQAVAAHLAVPEFRSYVDAHPQVRDADGDPVVLAFASDELMSTVIEESLPYGHATMLATVMDGHFFVCILGAPVGPEAPVSSTATEIRVDVSTTVASFAAMLLPLPEGQDFVVAYERATEHERVLVGSK